MAENLNELEIELSRQKRNNTSPLDLLRRVNASIDTDGRCGSLSTQAESTRDVLADAERKLAEKKAAHLGPETEKE